jgi:hypothetical protein
MPEIALFLEALQSCQEATADQNGSSDEEMTPLTCYYTKDGCPCYPDMKREDLGCWSSMRGKYAHP